MLDMCILMFGFEVAKVLPSVEVVKYSLTTESAHDSLSFSVYVIQPNPVAGR